MTSLVLSRLDYCNAVLAGLPASTLAPLQHAQARLALGLDRRSHHYSAPEATLAAGQVPCHLQNCYYIMHQTFHRRCPSYLCDLIVFALADSNVRQLLCSTTRTAAVKRSRTQFGRRAFSVAGPDIWNSLPATIRTIDSQPSFRRRSRHICSAQHLTINIDIVMHTRSIFNLYDWAL